MKNAIVVSIDQAGRLVIPKPLRDLAGIKPGMPLHASYRDGRVEIEPVASPVTVESRGGVVVAVPSADVGTLESETVQAVRDHAHGGRGED